MAKDRMDRQERKDLKGPDEFITATTDVVTWAQRNSRSVLLGVGGAVVVFLGLGFYFTNQAAQRRDANADLAAALATYRAGQFTEAAAALDRVSAEWNDSAIAPLAEVLAANSRLREGDAGAAITALSAVEVSRLPEHMRQQRDLAWATALEETGEYAAAAGKYAEAVSAGGPYTADALLGEARTRARNGETDRAAELYRKALADFPTRMNRSFIEGQIG